MEETMRTAVIQLLIPVIPMNTIAEAVIEMINRGSDNN